MDWLSFDNLEGVTPIVAGNYAVPSGKVLVITSSGTSVNAGSIIRYSDSPPSVIGAGNSVTTSSNYKWTGYLIDPTKF